MDDCSEPRLRADAARNRAALLRAAREVFATKGLDAPLDEIARSAGVGNATLYRRFPTREDLVEAVFAERMAEYADVAEKALAEPDPWEGFRGYLETVLAMQAEDRGMADLLVIITDRAGDRIERLRERAFACGLELIERARDAGVLRDDFRHQDVPLLLMANAGVVSRTGDAVPDAWRRVAAIMIDGLRAEAATQGAPPPPAEDIRAAMAARGCPS